MSQYSKEINKYINEIKIKNVLYELEHTGRSPLETLLENFAKPKGIQVTHEPKRDKKGGGSPDFRFTLDDCIMGILENKKINENLKEILESDQIAKYKDKISKNILVTDYLTWIWIKDGKVFNTCELCSSNLLEKDKPEIKLDEEKIQKLEKILIEFFEGTPDPIMKANVLSGILADPTRKIKKEINLLLTKENSVILELYGALKQELSQQIKVDEFSDMIAQTFSYSLFLLKLDLGEKEILTLDNIPRLISKLASFDLIRNIVQRISQLGEIYYGTDEDQKELGHQFKRVLTAINSIDSKAIQEDIENSKEEHRDPYIHFYEDFLNGYDKEKRKELGVWYTPQPVVQAIVRNIDALLKEKFFKKNGLANDDVKVLDFACGTGTFLLETYDKIFDSIPEGSLDRQNIIPRHILKNLSGFELLMPAYCVAHLKLSERLKEEGYEMRKDERIPVYFTNTLEDRTREETERMLGAGYEEIKTEGRLAHELKENKEILVVMGNPPYNGKSQNNFDYINKLIQPYYPNDEISERNSKTINDDYVKFIRFAEHKIEQSGQGIVGIITNHGFLDNPTFRAMRQHLMRTFEQIYIIDLHGNSTKKEKSPDGSLDQNVFDIQTGASLSFFVKKEGLEKGIFHKDVYGTRESKFDQLKNLDLNLDSFIKIEPTKPFDLFIPIDLTGEEEYKKGISLREIFRERNTAIQTDRDKKVIAFTQEELEPKIQILMSGGGGGHLYSVEQIKLRFDKYVEDVDYRPFDTRKIYWDLETTGIIGRPRKETMKHFLGHKNLGLIYTRQVNNNFFHCFITDKLVERCYISNLTKEGNSVAPLYLYQDNLFEQGKVHNFQETFWKLTQEKFNSPKPEAVLGYIYAVLHSPSYRAKYLEFLKIDFPRVPFDVSLDEFHRLSSLGQKLMDIHLLKEIPKLDLGTQRAVTGEKASASIDKIEYKELDKRLYFNKTTFFDQVPKAVWEFRIGGYQVLHQYLDARKGREISNDLPHIQNVIKVLSFTIETMKEIDKEPVNLETN